MPPQPQHRSPLKAPSAIRPHLEPTDLMQHFASECNTQENAQPLQPSPCNTLQRFATSQKSASVRWQAPWRSSAEPHPLFEFPHSTIRNPKSAISFRPSRMRLSNLEQA